VKAKVEDKIDAKPEDELPAREKVGFCRMYCNAFKYYHRLLNPIFSYSYDSSRIVKTMNTFTQLMIVIAIATAMILKKQVVDNSELYVPFIIMRLVQPIFNILESKIGRASKTGNVIVFLFFLTMNVSMQFIIGVDVSKPLHTHELRLSMCIVSVILTVLVELLIWDTVVMPLLLAIAGSLSPKVSKFFKMLRAPNSCCK